MASGLSFETWVVWTCAVVGKGTAGTGTGKGTGMAAWAWAGPFLLLKVRIRHPFHYICRLRRVHSVGHDSTGLESDVCRVEDMLLHHHTPHH